MGGTDRSAGEARGISGVHVRMRTLTKKGRVRGQERSFPIACPRWHVMPCDDHHRTPKVRSKRKRCGSMSPTSSGRRRLP